VTVFEDTYEIWYNALEHDSVETFTGPTAIETLLEAADRFEQLGNKRRDGTLVISIEVSREIPRGWIEIEGPALPDSYEEFRPFDDKMATITTNVDGHEAFICRSDAVRLNMEILEPDGVVAIDFHRGEVSDD